MASNINPLFEQDPDYPYFNSAEERAAFYSGKLSWSDDQRSCPAQIAVGPIWKVCWSKVVLKSQYS